MSNQPSERDRRWLRKAKATTAVLFIIMAVGIIAQQGAVWGLITLAGILAIFATVTGPTWWMTKGRTKKTNAGEKPNG
jgi:multisubunit Na+/H+ antiporter MnhG subunit